MANKNLNLDYIELNELGEYKVKYPMAGLSESEVNTHSTIKDSASQAAYKQNLLQYPDDYLEFDIPGATSDEKKAYGYISDMAKLDDPRYLNSLSYDELQTVVEAGISAKEKFNLLCAEADSPRAMRNSLYENWDKAREDSAKDESYRNLYDLGDKTKVEIDVDIARNNKDELMSDYESRITTGVFNEGEQPVAEQNGVGYFSEIKNKATDFFKTVKDAIASTAIGEKALELGGAIFDKTKELATNIKNRGADLFDSVTNDSADKTAEADGPDA